MGEIKRILNWRFLIFYIVLLLVNAGVTVYQQVGSSSFSQLRQNIENEKQQIEEYKNNPPEKLTRKVMEEYGELAAHAEYINNYNSDVLKVISNAETLKKFVIFSDPESFEYNNIIKTGNDYKKIVDVHPVLAYDKATEKYLDNKSAFFIAFIVIVIVVHSLFYGRDNGMWQLEHSAKKRLKLQIVRQAILLALTFITYALLALTSFISIELIYKGTDTLKLPIQNIEAFSGFTGCFSQLEYILYEGLFNIFILYCIACAMWFLYTIFRKRTYSIVIILITVCVEFVLYTFIGIHSRLAVLRNINIVRIIDINKVLRTYSNHGYGRLVVSDVTIIFVMFTFLLVVFLAAGIPLGAAMKPVGSRKISLKVLNFASVKIQSLLSRSPVWIKEIYKILFTCRGVVVAALGIFMAVFFIQNSVITFSESFRKNDAVYEERGGADYSGLSKEMDEAEENYLKAMEEFRAAYEKYVNEEITLQEYSSYNSMLTLAKDENAKWSEFRSKRAYLESIKEEYDIDGYMMSDRGYESIIGRFSKLREFMLLIIALVCVVVITFEYRRMESNTGMDKMLGASVNGRQWLTIRRFLTGLLLTALLCLIVYGTDIFVLYRSYGFVYSEAPVMSLTFMKGCRYRVSIAAYITMFFGIRIAAIMAGYCISFAAGQIYEKSRK